MRKMLHLKVGKKTILCHEISNLEKKSPLILKAFPAECRANRVSLYICLHGNEYVH